jgi:hypothetical protein
MNSPVVAAKRISTWASRLSVKVVAGKNSSSPAQDPQLRTSPRNPYQDLWIRTAWVGFLNLTRLEQDRYTVHKIHVLLQKAWIGPPTFAGTAAMNRPVLFRLAVNNTVFSGIHEKERLSQVRARGPVFNPSKTPGDTILRQTKGGCRHNGTRMIPSRSGVITLIPAHGFGRPSSADLKLGSWCPKQLHTPG